jgi:lysozyme
MRIECWKRGLRLNKRVRILIGVGLLLGAFSLTIAYVSGRWVPNERAARAYAVRGIDVSHHQGKIDWAAVASDGIGFAYIKATEGGDRQDNRFAENWREISGQPLRRGAYHFFTLTTSGKAQADNFLAAVPVDTFALPPAVDLEFGGNSSFRPDVAAFRAELTAFLARLRLVYRQEPVVYTDEAFYAHYLANYPIARLWIASTMRKPRGSFAHSWLFWQFTAQGRIRGIQTHVDIDVFADNAAAFQALVAPVEKP